MARRLLVLAAAAACMVGVDAASPWPPSVYANAASTLAQMNTTQKLSLVHGYLSLYVGGVPGIPEVGIPPQNDEDGPQGVADEQTMVTCWPSAMTVACSWDPASAFAFGQAMGREQWLKGTTVHLAPGVNLGGRVPWGGRVFEYLSEDPALASSLAAAVVQGIQSNNISATVKHWIGNEIENDRMQVDAVVPQRAERELYIQPFAAAVNAGVGAAMCSYNRYNGTYSCENPATIALLKEELGFDGYLMSDWSATHSTAPAAAAGLDQEMPLGFYFGPALEAAVASGAVNESRLDDMVLRMLRAFYGVGLMDPANQPSPSGSRNVFANASSAAHNSLARQLAEAATVLLQNEGGLLPLNATDPALKSIAVLGDNSTVHGEGSGGVITPYIVTPAQGITNTLSAIRGPGLPPVAVSYLDGTNLAAAVAAAKTATVAVVVVATSSCEGIDRTDLSLPAWQDALVAAVAAANPRTIVVTWCPGACFMPWKAAVPAILYQGMPGQEAGNALANTIFGVNNPSGRLPLSFPANMSDTWLGSPVNPSQYPGVTGPQGWPVATYSEGLYMGYKWYDAQGITPLFPFGAGLSYSSFSLSSASASAGSLVSGTAFSGALTVMVTVTNAGPWDGATVVQAYISYPAAAEEPPKLLRAFAKPFLSASTSTQLTLTIPAADLAVWDLTLQAWRLVPGAYTALLGFSSAEITAQVPFTVA